MSRFSSCTAVVATFVLAVGCQQQPVKTAVPESVAEVAGMPVLRVDFEKELARAQAAGRTNVHVVLEEYLARERLVARARQSGLENDPDVQRAFKNVLIAKLKERELEPRLHAVSVSAGELPQGAEQSPACSNGSKQVHLAWLRVQVSPKASAARIKQAAARIADAREKALALPATVVDFGPIAAEYSDDDATRFRGGDLGWLEADADRYNLEPTALAAGLALKGAGELSPVVRGKDGFYVVRVIAHRSTDKVSTKASEGLARYRAYQRTRRAVEEQFVRETREAIPVIIHPRVVNDVEIQRRLSPSGKSEPPQPPSLDQDPRPTEF